MKRLLARFGAALDLWDYVPCGSNGRYWFVAPAYGRWALTTPYLQSIFGKGRVVPF